MITVNNVLRQIQDPEITLSTWLREDLRLTGTKVGCEIGVCGSCTVLVDGEPRRSCKLKLKDVDGKHVLTIEGLASSDGSLHPIQQAFIDAGAVQCGFCTPGMVLTAYALLNRNPHPTRIQIRQALKGNLCRCTGYQQIVDAIELAAQRMNKE
jgi:carbon-monoxide dehydrogenase small subunit